VVWPMGIMTKSKGRPTVALNENKSVVNGGQVKRNGGGSYPKDRPVETGVHLDGYADSEKGSSFCDPQERI